jgi:glycosyltransferase involved in cell wall biosynthesis
MRILNVLPRIPTPPVDGGAIGVYYPMRELALLGHKLCTLAFESNRHPQDSEMYRSVSELYTIPGNFPEPEVWSALMNLASSKPYNLSLRFDKPEFHKLIKKVAAQTPTPDIIQLDWIYMTAYLKTLRACYPKVPIVLRQHNAEHIIFKRLAENEKNPIKSMFLFHQASKMKRFEAKMMKRVDYYTTVTETDLSIFKSMAPKTPGRAIVAGVDTAMFKRPESLSREKNFVILGSLSWAPYAQAVQWFLENVWTTFVAAHPGVGLYIVGSAPPPEVQRWNGTQGVTVTGFVDDVIPILHRSTAMVVPLLSGSGMRIKIVEAMAASLPVISTSVGIEGILAEHNVHALVADAPEAIASEMHQLIVDAPLATRITEHARQLVIDKYEWKSIAKQMEGLYIELTKEV